MYYHPENYKQILLTDDDDVYVDSSSQLMGTWQYYFALKLNELFDNLNAKFGLNLPDIIPNTIVYGDHIDFTLDFETKYVVTGVDPEGNVLGEVQYINNLTGEQITPFYLNSPEDPNNTNVPNIVQGIHFDNLSFGNDEVIGGLDHDIIVGDIGSIDIKLKTADNLAANENAFLQLGGIVLLDENGEETDNRFVFDTGDDLLKGMNGNDKIYGDIMTINMTLQTGINSESDTNLQAQFLGVSYLFGSDAIHGGVGDDFMVGDVGELNLLGLVGGDVSGTNVDIRTFFRTSQSPDGTVNAPTVFEFGHDNMFGDDGNDTIFGDIKLFHDSQISSGNLSGFFIQATAKSLARDIPFNLGDDTISAGSGADYVVGDIGTWRLDFEGASDLTNLFSEFAFPLVEAGAGTGSSNFLTVNFGSDTIDGDNGDDILIGDIDQYDFYGFAGDNLSGNAASGASGTDLNVQLGSDTINGGKGNDAIYGDIAHMKMKAIGGELVDSFGVELFSSSTAGTQPFFVGNITQFGNDTLFGDKGNDIIYGEGGVIDFNFVGGTNLDADVTGSMDLRAGILNANYFDAFGTPFDFIISAEISFGNDVIEGGKGNDYLYGDWDVINVDFTKGFDASENPRVLVDPSIDLMVFGDDFLDGGAGDDYLVGDVARLNFQYFHYDDTSGVPFTTNVNDDNVDFDISWGADTFHFDLDGNDGHDTIADYQKEAISIERGFGTDTPVIVNKDVLQFSSSDFDGINDMVDFTSKIDAVSDNGSDVVVHFSNDSSITLIGVGDGTINDAQSFLDIVNVDLIA